MSDDAWEKYINPEPEANDRDYTSSYIGTWSSISDVDTFLSEYTHDNNYSNGETKLACGDRIVINDGTYNTTWVIAGFDIESNATAADGTTYDNGYGIGLIPATYLLDSVWHNSQTSATPYKNSTMHTTTLPTVTTKLQTVLGSHLVQRNVLLSSSVDSNGSNAYTWTTAYATLMSLCQIIGNLYLISYKTVYDSGEANYKLPIFNKIDSYSIGISYFVRNIYGKGPFDYYYSYYIIPNATSFSYIQYATSIGVRPLIYIR